MTLLNLCLVGGVCCLEPGELCASTLEYRPLEGVFLDAKKLHPCRVCLVWESKILAKAVALGVMRWPVQTEYKQSSILCHDIEN